MTTLSPDDLRALSAEVTERGARLRSWAALEALPLAKRGLYLAKQSCDPKEIRYWLDVLTAVAGLKADREDAQQNTLPVLHVTFVNGAMQIQDVTPVDVPVKEIVEALPPVTLPPLTVEDMPDMAELFFGTDATTLAGAAGDVQEGGRA